MDIPDTGRIYSLVQRIAAKSRKYSGGEQTELESNAQENTSDLAKDAAKLREWLDRAETNFESGDEESLVEALVYLRIYVMNLATEFDNLRDELSRLFGRSAIGRED